MAPHFVRDSATLGFSSATSAQSRGVEVSNGTNTLRCRGTSNRIDHGVNTSTNGSVINVSDVSGLFLTARNGPRAADNHAYMDGVLFPLRAIRP